MSVITKWRKEPCSGCPWRKDTDMSIDPEAVAICGTPERPVMPGEPMMPCHKQPKDGADQNLCAAWLALYGWHHLGVRMCVGNGNFPHEVLEVQPDWPELHPDVESIIAASVEKNLQGRSK